jgi:NTE family protein
MLINTDWNRYIRTDYNRPDIPMRKKEIDYTYQGLLGLGINADNDLVLPTGVLKREPMLLKFMQLTQNVQAIHDFDKLSIPFRAVATNIENGDAVVLKSGSLAKAIYASSSIPGGFQPIKINGIDLVDGGVSDNIPIQVARDMGADIIIAVDVSEDFEKNLDVDSYFVVMGQLVNILMRKNANESIATLKDKDILLTPDLKGFGGLDADKYKQIIQRGVDVAQKNRDKLLVLSIGKKEYHQYQLDHRNKHLFKLPIIDAIEVQNPTYLSNTSVLNRIHQQIGEPLDLVELRKDLLHLYHMMIFDSVDYKIKRVEGKNILVIITEPSWDNHGEIRFAIGLEDDFVGHSAYSLKLGYTMYGLNAYGGEWKNNFEIGRYEKAYSEWFQPLDSMQRYYIKPSLLYESVTDVFPLNSINETLHGNQELYSRRGGATFAMGADVTTNYEFELGISYFQDKVVVDNIPISKTTEGSSVFLEVIDIDAKYTAIPLYISAKTDTLDNVNFPSKGIKAEIKWIKEMHSLGSDYNYEQLYLDYEQPFVYGLHNITLFAKYGTTYTVEDESVQRLYGTFRLGGLFNLSGYQPYSFNGDNVALGVLKYRYQLKNGGFFGSLNSPLYAGFSLESGDAWDKDNSINLKYSGTVYVAADTLLGALYVAYGVSDGGYASAYLYLGEKF